MKLDTKKIVVLILVIFAMITATFNLLLIVLDFTGIQEYEITQIEGVETVSTTAQMICCLLVVITSIIILILIGKLEKYKTTITILGIIQFLFGNPIISAVMLIILNKKTSDVEEKQLELPNIEMIDFKYKKICLILFVISFIIGYTTLFSNIIENNNNLLIMLIFLVLSIEATILPFVIMGRELKKHFKIFIKHFKIYVKYIIPKISIFIIIFISISLVLNLIIGEEATNQSALEELPTIAILGLSLIYAPIVEEITFRGFLKKGFKSSKLFIIASTIIFGYVHIVPTETNPLQYLYIILYGALGYFFAKIYDKTNNIYVSIFTHFLWNLISASVSLLTLI